MNTSPAAPNQRVNVPAILITVAIAAAFAYGIAASITWIIVVSAILLAPVVLISSAVIIALLVAQIDIKRNPEDWEMEIVEQDGKFWKHYVKQMDGVRKTVWMRTRKK